MMKEHSPWNTSQLEFFFKILWRNLPVKKKRLRAWTPGRFSRAATWGYLFSFSFSLPIVLTLNPLFFSRFFVSFLFNLFSHVKSHFPVFCLFFFFSFVLFSFFLFPLFSRWVPLFVFSSFLFLLQCVLFSFFFYFLYLCFFFLCSYNILSLLFFLFFFLTILIVLASFLFFNVYFHL